MHERDTETLRTTAAEFLAREAGRESLITVTRAEMGEDRKHGVIYITVYPDSAEVGALNFCNRNRGEFGKFFEKRVRGMRLPHVEFVIDEGEKYRRRLDELGK
ncbi:MAG: ribosome-binding factor A [Patescibacteria group bacterium]